MAFPFARMTEGEDKDVAEHDKTEKMNVLKMPKSNKIQKMMKLSRKQMTVLTMSFPDNEFVNKIRIFYSDLETDLAHQTGVELQEDGPILAQTQTAMTQPSCMTRIPSKLWAITHYRTMLTLTVMNPEMTRTKEPGWVKRRNLQ